MAKDLTGRWPWEVGEMDAQTQSPVRNIPNREAMSYTLPRIKDRRAEGGMRSASVKDLVRMKRDREGGAERYFKW